MTKSKNPDVPSVKEAVMLADLFDSVGEYETAALLDEFVKHAMSDDIMKQAGFWSNILKRLKGRSKRIFFSVYRELHDKAKDAQEELDAEVKRINEDFKSVKKHLKLYELVDWRYEAQKLGLANVEEIMSGYDQAYAKLIGFFDVHKKPDEEISEEEKPEEKLSPIEKLPGKPTGRRIPGAEEGWVRLDPRTASIQKNEETGDLRIDFDKFQDYLGIHLGMPAKNKVRFVEHRGKLGRLEDLKEFMGTDIWNIIKTDDKWVYLSKTEPIVPEEVAIEPEEEEEVESPFDIVPTLEPEKEVPEKKVTKEKPSPPPSPPKPEEVAEERIVEEEEEEVPEVSASSKMERFIEKYYDSNITVDGLWKDIYGMMREGVSIDEAIESVEDIYDWYSGLSDLDRASIAFVANKLVNKGVRLSDALRRLKISKEKAETSEEPVTEEELAPTKPEIPAKPPGKSFMEWYNSLAPEDQQKVTEEINRLVDEGLTTEQAKEKVQSMVAMPTTEPTAVRPKVWVERPGMRWHSAAAKRGMIGYVRILESNVKETDRIETDPEVIEFLNYQSQGKRVAALPANWREILTGYRQQQSPRTARMRRIMELHTTS